MRPDDVCGTLRSYLKWSEDIITDVENISKDISSITGIPAYLDWLQKCEGEHKSQPAVDDLRQMSTVIANRGFFVPTCILNLTKGLPDRQPERS